MPYERPTALVSAMCRVLSHEGLHGTLGGAPPEWLLLARSGESLGRDGRHFRLDDPERAIAAMAANGADIPVDWEHGTHLRGPQGEPAPAAGWVVELQARDGDLWGRVEWTEAGAEAIRSRAYRYYSPAYLIDGAAVAAIASVGLTNQPNLRLPALNHTLEQPAMPLSSAITAALDLEDGAEESDALAAIAALKTQRDTALNRAATPDLSLYVPRADFDAALNRATCAESALREAHAAELDRQIDALLDQGLEEARITPATLEYHRAHAHSDGGIQRLRDYLAAAPAVLDARTVPGGTPPPAVPELNSQAAAIAAAFGHTPEILAQYGAAR